MKINTYDIDGVIYMGKDLDGLYPGPNDVIITGRSFEEKDYTLKMLEARQIKSTVLFNPLKFEEKTRESSGRHKAICIEILKLHGIRVGIHFEDDPVQANIIRICHPDVNVVEVVHDLVEKENIRHDDL